MPDIVRPTRIHVTKGAVRVHDAVMVRCYHDLALVHLDLRSKYAQLSTHGQLDYPMVMLEADDATLDIDRTRAGALTIVEFQDFPGWDIEAITASKYTVRVCLSRRAEEMS